MPWVRLFAGDARRLPLADESVHCVVTSPPYWALRDYGLAASLWDGDPSCDHSWGASLRPETKLGHAGNTNGLYGGGRFDPGKLHATADKPQPSAFCSLCGAWQGCLGLEPTPELYVRHLVEIMRDVRRVLRQDGTVWLNLGDSYAGSWGNRSHRLETKRLNRFAVARSDVDPPTAHASSYGLKPKDLVGIPWRVAFALQADGWWLRSDIVWHKPNPMPESVKDRPTRSHEYLFLLAKSRRYYYDALAISEPSRPERWGLDRNGRYAGHATKDYAIALAQDPSQVKRSIGKSMAAVRNRRSVWTIPTQPFPGAHFATFPTGLVKPCILAGTSEAGCCPQCSAPRKRVIEKARTSTGVDTDAMRDKRLAGVRVSGVRPAPEPSQPGAFQIARTAGWTPTCRCGQEQSEPCLVLDPFMGAGTVGVVALKLGRNFVGVDLKPEYVDMSAKRIRRAAQVPQSVAQVSVSKGEQPVDNV